MRERTTQVRLTHRYKPHLSSSPAVATEDAILPTCRELGIGITAYDVLSHGLLSGHWGKEGAGPGGCCRAASLTVPMRRSTKRGALSRSAARAVLSLLLLLLLRAIELYSRPMPR
jgi:aryl-alcohol dehydrogenase-like predicted oxidoreductase